MKKKIFLVASMIAILACIFAISISATEYNKNESVTVTLKNGTQQCALYDADGDALVWYTLDDGETVQSVKTKNLVTSSNGTESTATMGYLGNLYLGETALQIHNNNTDNKIVVANFRDCIYTKLTHSSYKATFSNSTVVQYVYLPSTIKSIDCNIFQYCKNLRVCDIPSDASFEIINANVFVGCTSLKEINLIGCTAIKGSIIHSIFSGCTSLEKVVFDPSTINYPSLAGSTFKNAPLTQFGLTPGECTIPSSTTYIGNDAFMGSKFTKLVMSDSVTGLGYNVFQNSTIEEAYISSNLATSDIRVFMGCTNLTTVKGLENCKLTSIPYEWFLNCGLADVKLPSTATTIGGNAFKGSTITSIVIPAGFVLIDDYAFQNCKSLTMVTFSGNAGENAVIDQAAFENCKALTSIEIPEGVKTFGNCIFKGCSALATVSLPTTLTILNGGEHFYNTGLTTLIGFENTQITSVPYSMFRGLSKWTPDEIVLPNTVTSIGQYGFADVGMKSIVLGAAMKTIGTEAFVNCKNLQTVYLPSTLETVKSDSFRNNLRNDIVFFVTSSDEEYISTVQSCVSAGKTIDNVSYEIYSQNPEGYSTGRHVVYGLEICETFYGDHNVNGVIGENKFKGAQYLTSYVCVKVCTQCGGELEEEICAPLFVSKGYSKELGGSFFTYGIVINKDEILKYVASQADGYTFNYGIVFASAQISQDGKLFDENGESLSGAYVVDITNVNYTIYTVKVTGIGETQKDIPIYASAYALDNGTPSYIGEDVTENAVAITYNTVKKED